MDDTQALLAKYERLFEEQLQRHETEFAERMKVIDDLFEAGPGSVEDFKGFDDAFTKQLEEFFDSDPGATSEALEKILNRPPDEDVVEETVVETVSSEEVELRVVEIAIAKLEPTITDMVVFWLPDHFTQADAHVAGVNLKNVIQNRFRFAVFVRNAVSVSVIKGSSGKILLPS